MAKDDSVRAIKMLKLDAGNTAKILCSWIYQIRHEISKLSEFTTRIVHLENQPLTTSREAVSIGINQPLRLLDRRVPGAEDGGDAALLGKGWDRYRQG